jgi:hypothetical protein
MRLKEFAFDLLLWNSIQAVPRRISVPDLADATFAERPLPEPVRWLYGNVQVVSPVNWAPDIILTSTVEKAEGPLFDASRGF